MEDVDRSSPVGGRRGLARLLEDLRKIELMQRPGWPARERVAQELGPDGARLVEALVPRRPPKRQPRVAS